MGASGGDITSKHLDLAFALGRRIAERGCLTLTGACPGLPHAAARGAHAAGGIVVGISPALSRAEHVNRYESPLEPYDALIFTGSGFMGREPNNIHSSDIVIVVGGRSGTLGEFAIAYDEGKLIGILSHSGGVADELRKIATLCKKNTGSVLIEDADPVALVDACLAAYTQHFAAGDDALAAARTFQDGVG